MARITDLPTEIIESILWNLDSVHSLVSALHSWRRFYAFVQQREEMAVAIFDRNIGPVILPYVAALELCGVCRDDERIFLELWGYDNEPDDSSLGDSENSHGKSDLHSLDSPGESLDNAEESSDANDSLPDYDTVSDDGMGPFSDPDRLGNASNEIRMLLDALFERPSFLVKTFYRFIHLSSGSYGLLFLERKYNVINGFATEFAELAWGRLRENDGSLPGAITLSPTECDRFRRAFYRLEIFYALFKGLVDPNDMWHDWFFSRHSPWENEQIVCAYHLLEMIFAKASCDVLAHDVEFGFRKVDYLTPWAGNDTRQTWLSAGVEFIHDLVTEDDYDSKKKLLERYPGCAVNFPKALEDAGAQFSVNEHSALGLIEVRWPGHDGEINTTKKGLISRVLRKEDRDRDLGPRESWFAASLTTSYTRGLLIDGNDWYRDCAYLFWDWARVKKHHFLGLWRNPPVVLHSNYRSKGLKEMRKSFLQRSKIWRKGGRGYWSKGDTSRIVWTESGEEKEQVWDSDI